MTTGPLDGVKQQIANHWDRRAAGFDDDFGHSIRTAEERAAWDRILALILGERQRLKALDIGCGTGFLAFELAARGHAAMGIDFAPAMLREARRKAQERGLDARFEQADAEALPFPAGSFDLVISRHVLWTLPHPLQAVDEWIRVLRPGGRLAIVDGQFNVDRIGSDQQRTRAGDEYAAIADQLPFLGGRPQDEVAALLNERGLRDVDADPLLDLVAAQEARMAAEGRERRTHRRYVVWGDRAR